MENKNVVDLFQSMPVELQQIIEKQIAANVRKVRKLMFLVALGCIALFGLGMLLGAILF